MSPFANGATPTARLYRRIVIGQTVAILGLIVALFILGYFVLAERGRSFVEREAARVEQEKRDAEEVSACYARIDSTAQVVSVLRGLEVVLSNQVETALAAIADDPTSPLTDQRLSIVQTARPALRATRNLIATTLARRPTRDECDALQCRLDQRRTGDPPSPRCLSLIATRRGP